MYREISAHFSLQVDIPYIYELLPLCAINSADNKLMIFFCFSQKVGFDISCKFAWNVNAYFLEEQEKYFKMLSGVVSIKDMTWHDVQLAVLR